MGRTWRGERDGVSMSSAELAGCAGGELNVMFGAPRVLRLCC